jgi:cysteine synthase
MHNNRENNTMSKDKIKEAVIVSPEGKTDEELREIVQALQAQVQQYQTMAIKAQGALEVVQQMLSKEEKSEG